jgi:NADH:ubiquinone oxidoreductase subunit F (NADH-binding)/(2Fe-2S) ferredoxin
MPKLALQDLDLLIDKYKQRDSQYKAMLMVCTGTGCSNTSLAIRDKFNQVLRERQVESDYLVVPTGCHGFCAMGPIVVVQPEGIFYHKVKAKDAEEIVDQHLIGGVPVARLLYSDPQTNGVSPKLSDISFFSKQQLIALRNRGLIDPENIEHAIARGGYAALRKVLTEMQPEEVIDQILRSGLRGRGGGGFPTGLKWQTARQARQQRDEVAYVACNCDEGGPGVFMDRSIIESDPHAVLEGMAIGGYAIGATEGFVYIRNEYPLAIKRLYQAIEQARDYGLLGNAIFGSGFSFDITVHRGAGAFVCGESSALIASLAGRVGEPRAKYIHAAERGFRNRPTVLNNVETWATVPVIAQRGADWFAAIGTGGDIQCDSFSGSSGTKIFCLLGDVANTGLVEVPLGTSLREIIFEIGGGIANGRPLKAIQNGGPSGGLLPASLLDSPVDFDSLGSVGSMMGSGGIVVMNDRTCIVDVVKGCIDFLVDESCGKCTPCREGLYATSIILDAICKGQAELEQLSVLEELAVTLRDTSLCQLGGTAANPILSSIRYFRDEYLEHIRDRKCRAGVCKALISYHIDPEFCDGCTACGRACPTSAIAGELHKLHIISQDKCIKCGICLESCTRDAVEVK